MTETVVVGKTEKPLSPQIEEEASKQIFSFQAEKYSKGDYTSVRPIGKGSYGTVYSVRDEKRNITLVVKKIPKKESSLKEILNEVGILKLLKINDKCDERVLCFDSYKADDDNYYIITEYLDRYISLEQYHEKILNLQSYNSICEIIIIKLMENLRFIHLNKIAHRDFKPANIMVYDTLNPAEIKVKIIDFGTSCFDIECNQLTIEGGTVNYIAPEIYLGVPKIYNLTDLQMTDLWSLGIIIAQIISIDKSPFTEFIKLFDIYANERLKHSFSPTEREEATNLKTLEKIGALRYPLELENKETSIILFKGVL